MLVLPYIYFQLHQQCHIQFYFLILLIPTLLKYTLSLINDKEIEKELETYEDNSDGSLMNKNIDDFKENN